MAIIHPQTLPESGSGRNDDASDALAAGYAAWDAGDRQQALLHYRAALVAAPEAAEAWSALGQALAEAGEDTEAAEALTQALALDPGRSDLVLLLAGIYRRQERLTDAEDELRAFLRLTPSARPVMQHLAEIMAAQDRLPEAAALGRELFRLGAPPGDFVRQFCGWLEAGGAHRDAIEYLTHYLFDEPDDAEAWRQLGGLWLHVQEPEKADRAWRHYRALCPDDPAQTLTQTAAAFAADNLSPDYVRALFDGYAANFDRDVQQKLHYQAPALLHRAVMRVWGEAKPPQAAILDLGCGTGLAGREFAAHGRLTGVDLSPRMLARADTAGIYHALIQDDAVSAMERMEPGFDLILAADMLGYLGELTPLFRAAHRVLRPGGLFAMTAEQTPPGAQDFMLHAKRRYAHGENYLLRIADDHDFRIRAIDFCILRHENTQPVDGIVLVLEK